MAKKKEKKKAKEFSVPKWMVTFSDMVTLLLVFFVILISSADVEGREMQIVLSAFKGTFGPLTGGQTLSPGQLEFLGSTIEKLPSEKAGSKLSEAMKLAISMFEPEQKTKKVRIQQDERGIVISLMSDVLFNPGSADIDLNKAGNILKNLKLLLSGLPFKFRIEGHTDNKPLPINSIFGDNWQLSQARSYAVFKALKELPSQFPLDFEKISLAGYGETRPVDSNNTPEGRAYNIRVEIILLRE